MSKTFFLEPGLFARCDGLWYEPGILMVVEPGDRVELFTARDGQPGMRKAHYFYRQLDTREPPAGLRGDWRGQPRSGLSRRRSALTSRRAAHAKGIWTGTLVAA